MKAPSVIDTVVDAKWPALFTQRPRVKYIGEGQGDLPWGFILDFTDSGPVAVRGVVSYDCVEGALYELYGRCLKLQPEVCLAAPNP